MERGLDVKVARRTSHLLIVFCGEHVKSVVFKNVCGPLAELRHLIYEVYSQPFIMLGKSFTNRQFFCQEVQVEHFEHLLK